MKKLTNKQIDYIKENHEEKLTNAIHENIDNSLIYYSDIEKELNRFTNIMEVLRGNYTIDDLYSDLYNDYYNNDDFYNDFYNDYLYKEEQQEIDELED